MKIDVLSLKNFRCFEEIEIPLHENLTVIVAQNGIGKTTILDALRIMLWPYVRAFNTKNQKDPGNSISKSDVTIYNHEHYASFGLPSIIEVHGDFGDVSSWSRFRNEQNILKEDKNTLKINAFAKKINSQLSSKNELNLDLPVLGYYGTGRLWSFKKNMSHLTEKKTSSKILANDKRIGYINCLDPASSYRLCEKWIRSIFMSYQMDISAYIQRYKSLPMDIESESEEVIRLVQSSLNIILEDTNYRELQLFINPVTDDLDLGMFDIKRNIVLPIDQLSDGIRNAISLVLDIIYRCVKINPHLGDKANLSSGIILIDEVDMHLHPEWQQTILGQLQKVFVNLQFIVTTHSPQVLTTVEPECIRAIYLNPENNRYEYKIPEFSKGAESIQLLEDIFNVESRPPQIKEVQLLKEYEELVETDQWDSKRAIEIRKILDQWGKNKDTIFDKLDTRIALKRFKRSK